MHSQTEVRLQNVLTLMEDGAFHSGESLAASMNVSRAQIWKWIRQLEAWGLDIHAVTGKGYRLASPIELLDDAAIRTAITRVTPPEISVLLTTDSTNSELARRMRESSDKGRQVVLAEYQQAGRGRRGRQWQSPVAANLYLSLSWRLPTGGPAPGGLSLVVGIALVRALENLGLKGLQLKWPNDLRWQGAKLGGILVELSGEAGGELRAIIGVGLNVAMPEAAARNIEQPLTSLQTLLTRPLSRNLLAARVIEEIYLALEQFGVSGFASFQEEWRSHDEFQDRPVSLLLGEKTETGIYRGVDEQGALLLEKDGDLRAYHGGEVSLRYLA